MQHVSNASHSQRCGQNLIARLVPDNVGGLLCELASLPSRLSILSWAAPIPVLVEVDELPEAQRPQSADRDFWDVWTLAEERDVHWGEISYEWSGIGGVPKED